MKKNMWVKFIPYAVCVLVGAAGAFSIVKFTQPTIELKCEPAACNCPAIPECPPSNGIDFDKIKNVKGLTIQNHQYYVMRDTVSLQALTEAFRKVAQEQKLSRCK